MSRLTKFPNGLSGYLVDDQAIAKESNYTIIVNDDSGKTFTTETDGQVFTLPSIVIGNTITIVNMAEDGAAGVSVSPAALDSIIYIGSAVDNKDLINTKATAKRGDYVVLSSKGSASGWQVADVRGIWAIEA